MPPTRIERATRGLGNRCSIQLSYGGILHFQWLDTLLRGRGIGKCHYSVRLSRLTIFIQFRSRLRQVSLFKRVVALPHLLRLVTDDLHCRGRIPQRNTDFWTLGPYIEWRILPEVKLGLGYHYDEMRKYREIAADVSYVNHYGSFDIDIELAEWWRLLMATFHYERNNWTSGLEGDERRGAHENVYMVF